VKELLLEWAELEPERCEGQSDGSFHLHLNKDCKIKIEADLFESVPDPLKTWATPVVACIQAAVQEAIRVKGWYFEFHDRKYSWATERIYECYLFVPNPPPDGCFHHHGSGKMAAESFLDAYCKALEQKRLGHD
jgi:hypothetical protein